jgi:hypothetical protein
MTEATPTAGRLEVGVGMGNHRIFDTKEIFAAPLFLENLFRHDKLGEPPKKFDDQRRSTLSRLKIGTTQKFSMET